LGANKSEKMIGEWLASEAATFGNKAATIGLAENSDDGLMA